ncbi:MAG: hypothetical protein RIQ54_20 [Candidatus Parcubacteria bacterium]|jgi:DNA recombination protein RmuC
MVQAGMIQGMEIIDIVGIIHIGLTGVVLAVLLVVRGKLTANTDSRQTERVIKDENARIVATVSEALRSNRQELSDSLKSVGDSLDKRMSDFGQNQTAQLARFEQQLHAITTANTQQVEKMRETIEQRLQLIQTDNAVKLEKMRETVDEKLHATLEKRLGDSFKLVSDRLDLVHRGLGEMQTLASGVGDLKKVLQNVKTRGTWGEVQLSQLLEQILTADQYSANVATKNGSADRVEFAIKLPGKQEGQAPVWMPIDAKFPIEDYQRLLDASEAGDVSGIETASKALEVRIKGEAKDIREKYIDPPYTTDFGILFLPIEGLYAEVLRRPGLVELVQRDYRVIIAGPTTIWAILNSLQMGFRTLAIEKRSSDVWALLSVIKTEFGKFGDLLEKTQKKLQEASNTIEDATSKSRRIEQKLGKVQSVSGESADQKAISGSDTIN